MDSKKLNNKSMLPFIATSIGLVASSGLDLHEGYERIKRSSGGLPYFPQADQPRETLDHKLYRQERKKKNNQRKKASRINRKK